MPRRVNRDLDIDRTELLGLDELEVSGEKSPQDYFIAWLRDPEVTACPLCGGTEFKVQNRFSKKYWDIIRTGGRLKPVTLEYRFYKYRCLNESCGHIFAREMHFASQREKVTYRMADAIAGYVIAGRSYDQITELLPGTVTKPAVGQIFNRWVRRKEELRGIKQPLPAICVIAGRLDEDQNYTLFLRPDEEIRILDIQYGIDTAQITAKLRNIGVSGTEWVLADCDPVIQNALYEAMPQSSLIVPIEYWLKLVKEEFRAYAREQLLYRQEPRKMDIIMKPEEELLNPDIRDALLNTRPQLRQPYRDYQELLRIVAGRDSPWTYTKLNDWMNSVCDALKPELLISAAALREHREAIYHHELYGHVVPPGLFRKTAILEELLSGGRTFSDEQLKAKVLYSVPADPAHWEGVPINALIEQLGNRKQETDGGYEYEHQ